MSNPDVGSIATRTAIPVGRLPTGAGKLPAPPIFQTCLEMSCPRGSSGFPPGSGELSFGLPIGFSRTCRATGVQPTRFVLAVSVTRQSMLLLEESNVWDRNRAFKAYCFRKRYLISTSRYGVGQKAGSNQTPVGLHRIAEKIGGGHPIGTVFQSRQPVGLTWDGLPGAAIAHRILWLEGLQPGWNAGGDVDSHARFIYIHGVGDEMALGRPASRGCVHLAAADLLPLFDRLPRGTLVWIER